MFKTTIMCMLLVIYSCSGNENKIAGSRYNYSTDTITHTYQYEFSGKWIGGQDLHTKKGETWMLYNFCESRTLVFKNLQNDSVIVLDSPDGECEQVHTYMKKEKILVLLSTGKLFSFAKNQESGQLVLDLNSIPAFANSGMIPEKIRPGGDQRDNIPEDVIYFRVNQDFNSTAGKYSKYLFAYPVSAKLNLKSGKIQFFGKLPQYVSDNSYGLLSNIFDLYKGDSIIYSNPINGNLEVINTLTKRTSSIQRKSKYQLKEVSKIILNPDNPESKQQKFNHGLLSGKYEPLFYNPNERKYYRLYHPEMPEYNADGLLMTADDKLTVLMIFDENLVLEDELMLPIKGNQFVKLFPLNKGIAISIQNSYKIENGKSSFSHLRIRRK